MWYTEEVELIFEEMHLEWDGNRWRDHARCVLQWVNSAGHLSTSMEHNGLLEKGLRTYALCQASVRKCLFEMFAKQWNDLPAFIVIADQGLSDDKEVDAIDSAMYCISSI